MASESFLSSSWYKVARLRPKLRSHARVQRHLYRGEVWYVVHDLASGRVYRLSREGYFLAASFDGEQTVDAAWKSAAVTLGERAPSQDETIQLLAQLHAADLLESRDVPPDTAELFERHGRQNRSRLWRVALNPLAMRLPLWDPDRFLERWLWLAGPLFGRLGLALWLLAVVPAALLAIAYWPDIVSDISDPAVLLAPGNLVLIGLSYVAVKLLHELGHAFATKRFGGEVHDLGIMFLVLFPMPYVDASAAAALKSKWRRAAVGAVGMMVELFLAALAFYIWLAAEPGTVRAGAFNIMLIAGFSTVLFNGNPLLRYDGYYILMDVLEIPNLSQRSGRFWSHIAERYLFGGKPAPLHVLPRERGWLIAYAPLSFLYRILVVLAIAMFLATQYLVLGFLLAVWAVGASLVFPLVKGALFVCTSPRLATRRGRAVATVAGALAGLVAVLLFVPAPLHTDTEGVVWLPDSAYVRAGTGGFVGRVLLAPGSDVHEGDALIESDEPFLDAQVRTLRWRVAELQARLAGEEVADRALAQVTQAELGQAEAELAREMERAGRLLVRSRAEGTFVLPRAAEDLPGRYYQEGEVIGYVIPQRSRIVRVTVPQEDIDLVRSRLTRAFVKLVDSVSLTYPARLVREVPAAQGELPSRALGAAGGGQVAVDPRDPEGKRALERVFQFDLELPEAAPAGNFGSRVFVRFEHDWEPLGVQVYRRIRQLFLSRLQF